MKRFLFVLCVLGLLLVGYACAEPNSYKFPEELCAVGCTSLTDIQLPAALESIENYAFNGCAALGSVRYIVNRSAVEINAPDGVTVLNGWATHKKAIPCKTGWRRLYNKTFRQADGRGEYRPATQNCPEPKLPGSFYGCKYLFLPQAGRRAHMKWDLYQLLMLLVCTFPAFWEASMKLPLPR